MGGGQGRCQSLGLGQLHGQGWHVWIQRTLEENQFKRGSMIEPVSVVRNQEIFGSTPLRPGLRMVWSPTQITWTESERGGFIAKNQSAERPSSHRPMITQLKPLHFGVSRKIRSLKTSDVSWCLSDSGWILATMGTLVEPWTAGCTVFIHYLPQFDTKVIIQVRRLNFHYQQNSRQNPCFQAKSWTLLKKK